MGEQEAVDWCEAKELVGLIKGLPVEERHQLLELNLILAHAEQNEDWDSGDVAKWPDMIIECMESIDKSYDYPAD